MAAPDCEGVVCQPALLNFGRREEYKGAMLSMGELGRKRLPHAIPAEELRTMLGPSSAFCSWNPAIAKYLELARHWPFLFAQPVMGAIAKKPAQ